MSSGLVWLRTKITSSPRSCSAVASAAENWAAVGAVFESWESDRAVVYRELQGYPSDWGTAVTVQAMVFGNLGDDCATGVVFTRNPKSGETGLFGEYLVNAQGEDVVAGVRTPQPVQGAGSLEEGRSGGIRGSGAGLHGVGDTLPGYAGR